MKTKGDCDDILVNLLMLTFETGSCISTLEFTCTSKISCTLMRPCLFVVIIFMTSPLWLAVKNLGPYKDRLFTNF